MMMKPNNDIANNNHAWNKDMDDGIITTTTASTPDTWKLYWQNSDKYFIL